MAESGAHFEVPTIDVSQWDDGDDAVRNAIAADIDDASRSIGFIQITGHGIAQQVIDDFTAAMDDFFALPADQKLMYRPPRPSINRGYATPKSERLSYSLGIDSPADMFEAFNVGASVDDFPDLDVDLDGEVYASNLWPDAGGAPSSRPGVEAWFEHAAAFARRMASVFARALGLPDDFFDPYTDHSIDVLRMVNYALPAGTQLEPEQLGMGAASRWLEMRDHERVEVPPDDIATVASEPAVGVTRQR